MVKDYKKKYKEVFVSNLSIELKKTNHDEKFTFHIHDEFEILLVLSDNMKCIIGERTYDLPRNTLLLFNSMDLHHLTMNKKGINHRYVVFFKPEYIQDFSTEKTNLLECFYFRPFDDPNIIYLNESQARLIEKKLEQLNYYNKATDLYGKDLFVKISLCDLLLNINNIYRNVHELPENTSYSQINLMHEIINYIHKNYSEPISLDSLANCFFINKFHLSNLFKKVTGSTPYEYLLRCRLVKAKEFLLNGVSVEDTCSLCGYNNLSHFSRSFKQFTGCSPKQYQLNNNKSF